MTAVMTITYRDGTFDEIEFTPQNGKYWKLVPEGIMIRIDGVRGSRTVYPWHAIRNYHIETEAGRRDQEQRAQERAAERREALLRSGAMGGCGHVHEQADPGRGGPEGDVAVGPC